MISSTLYNQIKNVIPIASVEALILKENSVLLMKRINPPVKNRWWFPGGRIRKGEELRKALQREIKEETGLEITIIKLVGVYSRIFPCRHDITIVFLCQTKTNNITLNSEHSEYKFFKKLPKNLHPYITQVIKEAKIKILYSS
jgi:ADP-ribose pyrophosphatase YjhB (NUDIX family)